MSIISIIISIIALLVSVIVAWKNYLSPFNVSILSGNPRLEFFPLMLTEGKHIMRFTVTLPLQYINKGSQAGIIKDIMLEVSKDKSCWLFYPAFYCDYTTSTEATLGDSLTKKTTNIPFYPIHLNRLDSLYKSVIFVLDAKNKNFPVGTDNISPGKYHFSVKVLESGKNKYTEKLFFNVSLDNKQIETAITSSKQIILIPYTDELKDGRNLIQPPNIN